MRKKGLWLVLAAAVLMAASVLLLGNNGTIPVTGMTRASDMGLVTEERTDGLYVLAVSSDSLASRMGILPGDRIELVNGQEITTAEELDTDIASLSGNEVAITCTRNGEEVHCSSTGSP